MPLSQLAELLAGAYARSRVVVLPNGLEMDARSVPSAGGLYPLELYVLLEGTGRIRLGDEVLTLKALDAILVEPRTLRQVFNDTDEDALWLMVGAPPEAANTLEMTSEQLAWLYPDGPNALPLEIPATQPTASA